MTATPLAPVCSSCDHPLDDLEGVDIAGLSYCAACAFREIGEEGDPDARDR